MMATGTLAQIARFAAVGVTATATHYAAAMTIALAASPYLANLAGYATAVGVSYFGHQRFTFGLRGGGIAHFRHLPRFAATSLSALALSQLVLAAARLWAAPEALALGAAVLIVPPYTFLLGRFWVFR